MTTKIIITRHGHTFAKGDVITRVGARTDLDLVEEHGVRPVYKFYKLEKEQLLIDLLFFVVIFIRFSATYLIYYL